MVIRVIFGSEPCDIFVMADSDDESGKMHLIFCLCYQLSGSRL